VSPDEQREFLEANRLCVVGIPRASGGPQMSPVYYAMDGDSLIISTTRSRWKARQVRREPAISICVLGEKPPFPYLLIYGRGYIEDSGAVDAMMKIGARMTGSPLPESARPAIEERAKTEGRVVLRFTPERFSPITPYGLPKKE